MNMKKRMYACLLAIAAVIGITACNNGSDAGGKNDSVPPVDSPSVAASWKIGVQLWTFHYVPFVVAIEKADSAGIKYLEAFPGQLLGGGMKGSFGYDMTAEEKTKVKQLLAAKGISIVAMGVV